MTIYYIHGFGSCAAASEPKRKDLEQIFPDEQCIALDYDSSKPIFVILHNLCKQSNDVHMKDRNEFYIGTSLGGFLAYFMTVMSSSAQSVALFNPLINGNRMVDLIGENFNYCTNSKFKFSKKVAQSYVGYKIKPRNFGITAFLAEDDKVINPKETANVLSNFAKIINISGGHRIESFLPYKDELVKARYHIAI